ncbi:DegV family protein [Alkaliphilus peptidifermentans]|uniref:EDD domain protein, DegV family n=1 Tax=Alkaliphilus peptidifermentans DSM 18978 TaxID=1120976 RepID=A0A1G5K3A9_9FIRM|nr:DegV family protein [Alkaliphilus peptidifermentans]SCY94560.1 EDD domain protein, DegV family [Alkaliphilus peptidifermentans DSM 18978]
MASIKIITDSTCDLSPTLLKELDIAIVPLYVVFNEDSYKDGIDINTTDLYSRVNKLGQLPKTAAPSPNDFHEVFKPHIDNGSDILYVGLSSKISSTIQNAKIAANEFPDGRIKIVDSFNLSTGIGILALKAAEYAKEGLSLQEISAILQESVPKVKTAFVINTLDYLHKGGRCSALQSFVGGMFKIKPIIQVVEGKMILGHKTRGKMDKALKTLLEILLKDRENLDLSTVFITHSEADAEAQSLKEELQSLLPIKNVIITNAGCVISSHCGPKTVGIIYLTK